MSSQKYLLLAVGVVCIITTGVYALGYTYLFATEYRSEAANVVRHFTPPPTLDKTSYNLRLLHLAHFATTTTFTTNATTTVSWASIASLASTSSPQATQHLWPVKTLYPNVGAILPFKRIVAYYGNFYSKGMGVLGEYPEDQVLTMLSNEVTKWEQADPSTSVVPAIQYIAVVAQASAGREGKYILRMPDDQIDHAIEMANRIHGVVFLDVQVGMSTVEHEIPMLEKYLSMPNVHLAVDPEFSMKHGIPPGHEIGTLDASDINYTLQYLAELVKTNNLPPKILVVHRFTENMVTNAQNIKPLPEAQVVMDMDGWGSQAKKKNTYLRVIQNDPVQFTGLKLFYKNDVKPPSAGLLTTSEVMNLMPVPIYIQYQ